MKNDLINFVKYVLLEKSSFEKKHGKTYPEYLRNLFLSYATADHPSKYAFTMIQVERVGINTKSEYGTPAGVYCYPLTEEYFEKLIKNSLPFASNRPLVGLVKLRHFDTPGKWLKFFDTSYASDSELEKAIELCHEAYDRYYGGSLKDVRGMTNDEKIYNIINMQLYVGSFPSNRKNVSANSLLKKLGYVGVYDADRGVIHPDEQTQLFFTSQSGYETIGIFETSDLRSRRNFSKTYSSFDEWLKDAKIHQKVNLAFKTKSKKVLNALSKDENFEVRRRVVNNVNSTDEILKFIILNDDSVAVKMAAARNNNISVDTLHDLGDDLLRSLCFENIDAELCHKLVQLNFLFINEALSRKGYLKDETYEILMKNKSVRIRSNVSLYGPPKIIKSLIYDENDLVRTSIADNKNVSKEILMILSKDESESVAKNAIRRLKMIN
jgi:hypothetical protein